MMNCTKLAKSSIKRSQYNINAELVNILRFIGLVNIDGRDAVELVIEL